MQINNKYRRNGTNMVYKITGDFSPFWILDVYPAGQPERAVKNLALEKIIMAIAIEEGKLILV